MDAEKLQLFVREVERQAQFGLIAAEDLRRAVAGNDVDRIWYSIQGLLVATANVSKLLWPSESASSSRGDTLRKALRVRTNSPLKSKRIRNHFEHFDERLEKRGISPNVHLVVDSNIGSREGIRGGPTLFYVRNFDPSTGTLTFCDDKPYKLAEVIDALEKLRSLTRRALE